jgi:hypothetical protein
MIEGTLAPEERSWHALNSSMTKIKGKGSGGKNIGMLNDLRAVVQHDIYWTL